MPARLEHANLSVHDLSAALRFLQAAFPEFRIRHQSTRMPGETWIHMGTDDTYLALNEIPAGREVAPAGRGSVLNHLAFEVDDVEAVRARLRAAGFDESGVAEMHPYRKRVYFFDADGNDWEFVQYLAEEPAQRHDYTLPDVYVPSGRGGA